MTINELFSSINLKVNAVNSIVNSINRILYTNINNKLDSARYYTNKIFWDNNASIWDKYLYIYRASSYLIDSYEHMLAEYSASIVSIRHAMEKSFTTYYNQITYLLESAIATTWNEITNTETYLNNRIDAVRQEMLDILDQKQGVTIETLNALKAEIMLEVDEKISIASLTTDAITEEINITIEDTTTSIYETITTWVDKIWSKITPFFDWVQEEFMAYYYTVRAWIADKAKEIYANLTKLSTEIYDFVNKAISNVRGKILYVQNNLIAFINEIEQTIRSWVQAGINEINSLLTELSILSDWRFQFLNIFMSKPELSFLEMLNRDEVMFKKYKPYWQALFARIMIED